MSVTVVVVHRSRPSRCDETVAALRAQRLVDRVIVVDNGSSAEDVHRLRRMADRHRSVNLIELAENTGFGPAANRGLEAWLDGDPAGTWCVVCPDDASPTDGLIDTLVEAGADEQIGLLCADVGDGASPIVDHAFGPITTPALVDEGIEDVDYPHGTFLLARRACLAEIGTFDERYFAYCEEADLGLRARRAGWRVGLVRGARVVNQDVSSPTAVVEYLMERNTVLLLHEHFGRRKAWLRILIGVGQLATGLVRPSRRGPFWAPRARARALLDAVRGRWGPPPASLTRS